MKNYIKERALKIGRHIIETKETIRTTRKQFDVARSTVYRDITKRLPLIDKELANKVIEVLEYHKTVRHIRGGEATKRKYINQ